MIGNISVRWTILLFTVWCFPVQDACTQQLVPGIGTTHKGTPVSENNDSTKPACKDLAIPSTILWYAQPAQKWMEALPVGNGRLGAMIFGKADRERIQLNEQTVWTGGPYDPNRPGGPEALPEIRRLVFAGKFFEAEELFAKAMMGKPAEQMEYQPMGDLILEFPEHTKVTDYRRQLDLDTAMATVSYRSGGVKFQREVFSSPVDQVIVIRLSADKPGSLSFSAKLAGVTDKKFPDNQFQTAVSGTRELVLTGKTRSLLGIEGRVRFECRVQLLNQGGKTTAAQDHLSVAGADTATLILAAATNFKRYDDISANPAEGVQNYLKKAEGKSYDQLRSSHVAEHQRLFRRVIFDMPATASSRLPTDQRLQSQETRQDPQLAILLFQYGRYLLVSSSRPGCQPANLQGIWNEDMVPAWGSRFTTNINLEMNYWPAEVTNLAECVEPLVQLVKELAETGTRVAKIHYGARGWVFHQNTDQWRYAAPMDGPTWGTFSTGGAWLCTHLWDHYRFHGNREYLRAIYPLLKGSAQFFLDTLVKHPDKSWLVTCPATSPENFPAWPGNHRYHDKFTDIDLPGTTICAGSTIDMQILRDLFDACAESAKILGIDKDFREQVLRARQQLAPMQIGKQGNLQEWLEDWGDLEPKHRHISHLYGLYPSHQITLTDTPELARAAMVTLQQRGEIGTGFGMAWKAACWARLRDGDHANLCLTNLLDRQTCPNLFSKCFKAPQVDGSLGATAAIAEMLLQSQPGEIHLLPALPKNWPTGSIRGLRTRGGFEVHMNWLDGKLRQAIIHSLQGNPLRVHYGKKSREVNIKQGEEYRWSETE